MNNGIKPTHLWKLTGRKHFLKILEDRKKSPYFTEQRSNRDMPQLMALIVTSFLGIAFTYGRFAEEDRKVGKIKKDGTCSTDKSKPKCTPPKVPCLPDNTKYKPCGGED